MFWSMSRLTALGNLSPMLCKWSSPARSLTKNTTHKLAPTFVKRSTRLVPSETHGTAPPTQYRAVRPRTADERPCGGEFVWVLIRLQFKHESGNAVQRRRMPKAKLCERHVSAPLQQEPLIR